MGAIFYIAGSVSNASFNISNWTQTSREAYAGIWLGVIVLSAMVIAMENSSPKS